MARYRLVYSHVLVLILAHVCAVGVGGIALIVDLLILSFRLPEACILVDVGLVLLFVGRWYDGERLIATVYRAFCISRRSLGRLSAS